MLSLNILIIPYVLFSRGYYIVVVPLKKQRTGKFLKPWDNPDEMNLEEVGLKDELVLMTHATRKRIAQTCHVKF